MDALPLPTEAISETYPKSDAEANLLRPIIAKLLRTIPETWTAFDCRGQTSAEERAASLLVAAGMVERRGRFRASFTNHPVCFELRWEATGESGYAEVVERVSADGYATWGDAWREWKTGETGHVSPFHTEHLEPQEWRLTDQGSLARKELESDAGNVLDFVLKRGPYGPGYWVLKYLENRAYVIESKELLARYTAAGFDWKSLPRLPMRGHGRVVSIRRIENPTSPQAVSLTNWAEGGDALATAFAKKLRPIFEAMSGNHRELTNQAPSPDVQEATAERPEDSSAFAPAADLWKGRFTNYKTAKRFLDSHPEIRTRKPGKQRLEIHAGDWTKYWAAQDARGFDALDGDAPPEITSLVVSDAKERYNNIHAGKQGRRPNDGSGIKALAKRIQAGK